MKKINWWVVGYNAAMKAKSPADLDKQHPTGDTEFQRKLFKQGWNSVWGCERRDEVKS